MKITWEPKDARLGTFVKDRRSEAVSLIGYIYEQRSMGDNEAVVKFLNTQDMVPHGEIKW